MYTPLLAVEPQWIIALASLTSALIALALGLGLRDWVTRPRVRLVLRRVRSGGDQRSGRDQRLPHSNRIVDLASVDLARNAMYVEISHPWPPNEANRLEPAVWRLELLVCGDNIRAARSFVTVSFDGTWPAPEDGSIWEHFVAQRRPAP